MCCWVLDCHPVLVEKKFPYLSCHVQHWELFRMNFYIGILNDMSLNHCPEQTSGMSLYRWFPCRDQLPVRETVETVVRVLFFFFLSSFFFFRQSSCCRNILFCTRNSASYFLMVAWTVSNILLPFDVCNCRSSRIPDAYSPRTTYFVLFINNI